MSLIQGAVRGRPGRNTSQAHGGVQPLSDFTYSTQSFQPLPPPIGQTPYHFDLANVIPGIAAQAGKERKIVFHTAGDTGGIKNAQFQANVAAALVKDIEAPTGAVTPAFLYHLGDVVYYNGEVGDYYSQFYEPYEHYSRPVLSIPGNHDGDPVDATQTSLDGWVRYFMTRTPGVDPISHDAPRVTLSLPNVYWTLEAPFFTLVGMYTNVPEHGSIDSAQQQWLTNEFAQAPNDKALIVALHHPVYSFDSHHSGSARMADAVQHAMNDSRRVPNLVLAAHVHNYQRIEKTIVKAGPTPFIVAGGGGYYNLHTFNTDVHPDKGPTTDPATGATLRAGSDDKWSYVTLTVDATSVSGAVTLIDRNGNVTRGVDPFRYPAGRTTLAQGVVAEL
jgi:acid phosphatase type 7